MFSFLKSQVRFIAPIVFTLVIVLSPLLVFAQSGGTGAPPPSGGTGLNPPSGGTGTQCDPNSSLCNPLAVDSICELIALLLKAAIAIGIPIAVLFIVWAGFKFIMARGSPGALTEARSNLVATLIGIAIFIGASLIANVIIATLNKLGVDGITVCTF